MDNQDFAAARIDTRFLDRLLVSKTEAGASANGLVEVAAVSAALFAAFAPGRNGQSANGKTDSAKPSSSNWKRAARSEALRYE